MKRLLGTALVVVFLTSLARHQLLDWIPLPKPIPSRTAASSAEASLEPPFEETPILLEAPAAPQTVEPEKEKTLATRWNGLEILIALAGTQNPDGSWGHEPALLGDLWVDRTGITALTIVAFVQSGYSHLSKDVYDGIEFGTAVKNGLKWLLGRQQFDGFFPAHGDPSLNQVLATWALSEAYGMSATELFKEPAQRSVDALARIVSAGTGLGGNSRMGWTALALASAKLSELVVDPDQLAWPGAFAAAGWGYRRDCHQGRLAVEPPDPGSPDLVGWLFGSIAVRHFDRSGGSLWQARWRQVADSILEIRNPGSPACKDARSASIIASGLLSLNLSLKWWHPETLYIFRFRDPGQEEGGPSSEP